MDKNTRDIINGCFNLRRDKRYRKGFLQACVSLGAINNVEFAQLYREYLPHEKQPLLYKSITINGINTFKSLTLEEYLEDQESGGR